MYLHAYIHIYFTNWQISALFVHSMYVCLYASVYQFSLEKFNWKYMQANMCLYVLQNFALFVSRLRKSSFISRQHLINNSKPITSLSSSILWSLSSLTTTTVQWGGDGKGDARHVYSFFLYLLWFLVRQQREITTSVYQFPGMCAHTFKLNCAR